MVKHPVDGRHRGLKREVGEIVSPLHQLGRESTRRLMYAVYVHCFNVLHSLPW